VELTTVQRRTLEGLLDAGEGRSFDPAFVERLRERIASAAGQAAERGMYLRLSKERLNDHGRCDGLFRAGLAGERPPFEHSLQSAAGTLLHKCIELEIGSREERPGHVLGVAAAERLDQDRGFGRYWRGLQALDQDELVLEAVRRLELFRATFPPLRDLRRLAPIAELSVEASFAGGAVVASGRIDVVFGVPRPDRATRVLIDLKTGRAWPEHPEDMRLYALLYALRFGVPPFRVATLFLGSGDWQPEDVTESTLEHAAYRLEATIWSAVRPVGDVVLSPGPYCSWCPRVATCPAAVVESGE
jgi:hypothetical protein